MATYIHKTSTILFIVTLGIISISFTVSTMNQKIIEDIYTQTDRPFYFPGETIWFKSYIVDETHKITTVSDLMYAELISPKGTVVKKLKIGIHHGYAYGNFDTKSDWVGGIYTIKMYTHWMHNYGEEAYFTKKIVIQKVIQPKVLLKLKFEKEGYGKSSTVTANFEAKDLKNNPLSGREISYNVAVKGKIVHTEKITTDTEGIANPTFILPKDLSTIDAVLTVLIPYNGSTESISRSIPIVLDTVDLQFFPESGKVIAGTVNTIAFKALNEFGKPVDIAGDVLDEEGKIITSYTSYHDGMGDFKLYAKPGMTYYTRITAPFTSEKRIQLPKVYDQGVNFSATIDSSHVTIGVFSTLNQKLQLEVANASTILLKKEVDKDQKVLVIPTTNFPIGITRFTIFDSLHIPLAERLVFLNNHKQLNIHISTDKESYETREKVTVHIKTTDANKQSIPANLSMAVVDNKLLSFADDKQDDILSYFLMSSELQGKIHKPVFYFDQKEPKAAKALDYVMLTHGWRTYLDTDLITKNNAVFLPEQRVIQKGKVVDKKGRPVKAHLMLFDKDGNKVLVFDTNDNGEYVYKLGERRNYILIAYTDDDQSLHIVDTSDKNRSSVNNTIGNASADDTKVEGFRGIQQPLKKIIKKKATASVTLDESSAQLEECVVMAYGIQERKIKSGSVTYLTEKEINTSTDIAQILQGRVGGVNIINADGIYGNTAKINIRGSASISGDSQPLYIIDGIPISSEIMQNIDTARIESVTVLKGATATSLYGSQGHNGVVVIATKQRKYFNDWGMKKLNNAKFNNYAYYLIDNSIPLTNYIQKRFYTPVYDSKSIPEERIDFRKTIYWNPVVQTDGNGEAAVSFYNSDAITSFKITTEGVGYNGLIGRMDKEYSTKKSLHIDFKAPNYMALNDTVVLPITIQNESKKTLEVALDVELPEEILLLEKTAKKIKINPNATILKHITIVPINKGENKRIIASVNAGAYSDTVNKEVVIVSPYFPTQVSISECKNESFDFDVNSVVKQSLKANFTVYTDIIGDVMNGIESLISQPHGCFEQTSSSTYPNILVLKYLNETGKINPEVRSKAMKYIKDGYKRLISFETKENGFEWFGSTPPHETLTAYGILEFTEMKEIYSKVDQEMINRSVTWLMNRKDGKGGFKKSKEGYDSFTSSPKDVADAYIVYAISESGIKVAIEKEYLATYTKALKSYDTYRMALLAAASFNFNKPEKGYRLLREIEKNIEKYGFKGLPVTSTITRSYGNAKNIETVAFTLLALMKVTDRNETLISKGIEHLVSQRKGGRFGSTQSTAMALKALITYTQSQKRKLIDQNQMVKLIINGKELKKGLKVNEKGKVVINDLNTHIREGKQTIEVRFANPKSTFSYEMNVGWDSSLPDTSPQCQLQLKTTIEEGQYKVGDNIRMTIEVNNKSVKGIGMPMAIVGIPSGTTTQPWQLKELLERKEVAFLEISENYLILYWREFSASEHKTITLDLKADIAGSYQAPASTAYQYYADEYKHWIPGNRVEIEK
ncbi:TonB-dependent receptor plug domain-containing protein [Aquimarina sediminis]|uniref:TonB-dependent receptor plug domain-containing protein n=1 Tax=Aquimarina sediminis TaxID=2070536 RepID=UPI000CA05302|nr:TonB-dependent receptor plug domain-containing protein [Aquimarina sediminis]